MAFNSTRGGLFHNPRQVELFTWVRPEEFLPAEKHPYRADVLTLSAMTAQVCVHDLVEDEHGGLKRGRLFSKGQNIQDFYGIGDAVQEALVSAADYYARYKSAPRFETLVRVSMEHLMVQLLPEDEQNGNNGRLNYHIFRSPRFLDAQIGAVEAAQAAPEIYDIWSNGEFTPDSGRLTARIEELYALDRVALNRTSQPKFHVFCPREAASGPDISP